MKVAINESTLTAIGDAIREKTDTTDLLAPGAMPAAIRSITTGEGGGSDVELEKIDLDGKNCDSMFINNCWDDFLTKYGTTLFDKWNSVASAQEMFQGSELETIPFNVNVCGGAYFALSPGASHVYMSNIFTNCKNLIEQPGTKPAPYRYSDPTQDVYISGMYQGCQKLKEIDISNWDWDSISRYYVLYCSSMFRDCYSLRTITGLSQMKGAIRTNVPEASEYAGSMYNYLFYNCYVLDSAVMSSYVGTAIQNMFVSTFNNCHRLKQFRLSGGTRKWKDQVIDLSSGIGYDNTGNCAKYLEDATKQISGDSSYNDYKNDSDYWTKNVAYSRYNKTSAAETLNSLPNTSAFGTNTIKFRGDSGSATDGGAIDTLSESQIAAAAAKGWTVTFIY